MLMVDVENAVMTFQMCLDEDQVRNTLIQCLRQRALNAQNEYTTVTYILFLCACQEDVRSHFGSLIYSLDRLYKAVIKPARESGEWARSDHLFL